MRKLHPKRTGCCTARILGAAARNLVGALLLSLAWVPASSADELQVLSAVGMRQVLLEVEPEFERTTGHKLVLAFDSGSRIVQRIKGGDAADVVLIPQPAARQLISMRRVVTDSVVDIGTSRVGLAVRAGAPKPDITTPEGLRQTLLMARAIARPDPELGGSSGVHIQRVVERLGIAKAVASKTIFSSHPDREAEMPGHRVAAGHADVALHQIQELNAVPGITVVGPFPGELDIQFVFSAALRTGTPHAEAGKEFLSFLRTPRVKAAIKRKGMEPLAR
jgi:molybdate transport system substrate-binding protein